MSETTMTLTREQCLEKAATAERQGRMNLAELWELRADGMSWGEAIRRVRGQDEED